MKTNSNNKSKLCYAKTKTNSRERNLEYNPISSESDIKNEKMDDEAHTYSHKFNTYFTSQENENVKYSVDFSKDRDKDEVINNLNYKVKFMEEKIKNLEVCVQKLMEEKQLKFYNEFQNKENMPNIIFQHPNINYCPSSNRDKANSTERTNIQKELLRPNKIKFENLKKENLTNRSNNKTVLNSCFTSIKNSPIKNLISSRKQSKSNSKTKNCHFRQQKLNSNNYLDYLKDIKIRTKNLLDQYSKNTQSLLNVNKLRKRNLSK